MSASMTTRTPASLWSHFSALEDPRIRRCRKHSLQDILVISICGFICGVDNWVDMELFGKCKEKWFRTFLALPNGIPSHDTFGRVFAALEPEAFSRRFTEWMQAVAQATEGKLVAIDGKAVRRSFDKASEKAAIHMVSAWVAENRLVLGQVKTEEKSNEITAIPRLLEMLSLDGSTVTLDAMGCQREIVKAIAEKKADYVISLKGNQETLHREVEALFATAAAEGFAHLPHKYTETFDEAHGRVEMRRCWVTSKVEGYARREEWQGLKSFAMVESERTENNETKTEVRYFISSLPGNDAEAMLRAIRTHWAVENDLHWSLDVAFREDESRVRKGNAQQNMALMRRLALSLLKQDSKTKAGIAGRRKKAGWSHDYLLDLITLRT